MEQNNTEKGKREKSTKSKHASTEKRRAFPRKKPYILALFVMAFAAIAFLLVLIIADLLPPDLTVILSVVVVALLLLTNFMFASRYRWKRIIGIVVAMLFIVVLATVTSFMASTYETLNKISATATDATGPASIGVNVTEEPFNIYITGIDQWEEEEGLDLERSDVNMIITVNRVTKKVMLTSIPRDSYVLLHTAKQMLKCMLLLLIFS